MKESESIFYLFASTGATQHEESTSTVFYKVKGESLAKSLCGLFTREYADENGHPVFHHKAAASFSIEEKVLLGESLGWLDVYSDPDPGVYEKPPSKQTLFRAQYAIRAEEWERLFRERIDANDRHAISNSSGADASQDQPTPSISAGGSIRAGRNIQTAGSVRAGGSIEAGGSIQSGVTPILNASSEATAKNNAHEPKLTMPTIKRNKVFVSYSHKDTKFLDELRAHLKPLERADRVIVWSDTQIEPGSQSFAEIKKALAATKVAVLLVTQNFLASDFIHEHELGPLLKDAANGGVTILWVLVRNCNWRRTQLEAYQAAFPPDKALAEMKAERDSAWVAICGRIETAANA